ncbi:SEC-C metal-binding domain-containing protein [Leisingera sp. JC11]|uniref:SEC-C metal-binding domain-containing protein n=1 Tax=Leisingera sp. JC11 TaxID=3042469 RepID=UPI0034535C1A
MPSTAFIGVLISWLIVARNSDFALLPASAARVLSFTLPSVRTSENAHIYEDAARMAQPGRTVNLHQSKTNPPPAEIQKTGRNKPCPCGSGKKYKKCHGR